MKDKNQKSKSQIEVLLRYANNIIATLREAFLVLDKNLKVISANQAFYTAFNVTEKDIIDRLLPDLGDRQWNVPELLQLLRDIVPEIFIIFCERISYDKKGISEKFWLADGYGGAR